jgi:iron complex transport system substrate-binding protein
MAVFAFALATSNALKVASLDLCADEYLLLLARDAQVAAVSRLSRDPAESPLWQRARRFPSYGGRAESLLGVKPTVVLSVGSPGAKSTQVFARRLGWKSVVLPYPATPTQVAANVATVGALLGAGAKANAWAARLSQLRRAVPPAVPTLFLSGGGLSVDPTGLSAQWMALAGFRQLHVPGGKVRLERLATHPPAALLLSDYRSGQMSLGQRWLDHPLVRASTSMKVHTDGRPWTCAGPLMLGEVTRLRSRR